MSKIKIIGIAAVCLAIISLFSLWRITAVKLSNAQEQLTQANAQLEVVKKENENLLEYMKQRDKQIKDLEKAYQEQLAKIPADACGDLKPSKELIEFFKQGQ